MLWSDITGLRCHGLSAAAFVGRDCQSDKQAAELMTARGPPQWDTLGLTVYQFATAMIVGTFTAARLFEPHEMLLNCLSGYYACLFTCAFAFDVAGCQWERRVLAQATCRNLLSLAVHGVLRVARWPKSSQSPFELQYGQEDAAEHHFSRTKHGARGSASLTHGILGTVREHLTSFNEGFKDKEVRIFAGLSEAELKDLSTKALYAATKMFVTCSVGLSGEYAISMLRNWWDETGRMWLTSTSPCDVDEDDEFALDVEVEEKDPAEKSEDATAVLLANLEVESDLHKDVARLVDATLDAQQKREDAQPLQNSGETKDGAVPVSTSEAKPVTMFADVPLTLVGIFQQVQIPEFKANADTEADCIARVKKLYDPMKGFIVAVREEEGFAPKLALDTDGEELNSHNQLQRMLAQARQEMELNNSRRSRMQLWTSFAERCVAATKESQEHAAGAPVARVPQSFRPSCVLKKAVDGQDANQRDYQVLCARTCPDDKLRLVLVQSVYRGAMANKKGGTRALRATKPHYGVLPAHLCARVHACILAPSTDSSWFYCSNASFLLPYDVAADQIMFEVPAEHFRTKQNENLELWVNFKPEAIQALVSLKNAVPAIDKECSGAIVKKSEQISGKSFHYQSFTNSEKGRAAIRDYMSVMRRRYEELRGRDLVDKEGLFTEHSPIPKEPWADVLTKAPWYLTTIHKSKPDSSSSIFLQLRGIVPTQTNGWQKFHKFLAEVHKNGPELLPA
eukprot:s4443_g4.t1